MRRLSGRLIEPLTHRHGKRSYRAWRLRRNEAKKGKESREKKRLVFETPVGLTSAMAHASHSRVRSRLFFLAESVPRQNVRVNAHNKRQARRCALAGNARTTTDRQWVLRTMSSALSAKLAACCGAGGFFAQKAEPVAS